MRSFNAYRRKSQRPRFDYSYRLRRTIPELPLEKLKNVTIEQALNHPNWSMGNKVTIDSATMANKGLELIEAHWLFDLPSTKLEVVIHPTSIVHAMVRFIDGCCMAQLSPPSMTFALQHALLFPDRAEGVQPSLDFSKPLDLNFSPPSLDKFPCLRLAKNCLEQAGSAPWFSMQPMKLLLVPSFQIVLAFCKSLTLLRKHCQNLLINPTMTSKPYYHSTMKPAELLGK